MPSFQKFNSFVEAAPEKVHNLGADTLKVMLTLTAPVATNAVKALAATPPYDKMVDLEVVISGLDVQKQISDYESMIASGPDAIISMPFSATAVNLAAGNGYTAGGTQSAQSSSAQTSGVYKLVIADVVFTASGSPMAAFRYAVLYNDTATNKELIGFWDYGSSLTLGVAETLTVDFDGTNGVLTIT